MYKLMIADDEIKIRKGLGKLDWSNLGIEVAGEASNGLEAIEVFKQIKPDIMLVDICMPFLSGLELIGKINEINPYCITIIVSGYDEFEYAKEAVRLNVFDYILKPVNKNELLQTVKRGIDVLQRKSKDERFIKWAQSQISTETSYLKQQFIKKWLEGSLLPSEIKQNLDAFNIEPFTQCTVLVVNRLPLHTDDGPKMNPELLDFCIINIMEEIIEPFAKPLTYTEKNKIYCAIIPGNGETIIGHIEQKIQLMIQKYLKKEVVVKSEWVETLHCVGEVFKETVNRMEKETSNNPIILLVQSYVEKNYSNSELSLQEVADKALISSAYLSRLLKKELGLSFTDLVQKVRMQKATELLQNPTYKIADISEKIGYSTQHYFCVAFKKTMGVSPIQFRSRKEGTNEHQ